MVHTPATGDDLLAVVALFLLPTAKEDNLAFSLILEQFEKVADVMLDKCDVKVKDISDGDIVAARSHPLESPGVKASSWSLYDIIPKGTGFYFYDGGLTTPPCTEIVQWSVANTPLAISVEQYARLVKLLLSHVDPKTCQRDSTASPSGSTSRPTQPLNGRAVEFVCPVDSNMTYSGNEGESGRSNDGKWKKRFGFSGAVSICCLMGLWLCACCTQPRGYRKVESK